jgi:hypothetical protein
MTILEDLEEKLADALGQVQKVTAELNEFSNIKQSLQSTDEGVRGAAVDLDKLSISLEKGASALERASMNLSDTNEIISKTDPAEILKELGAITARQDNLGQSLKGTLQSNKEDLSSTMNSVSEKVQSTFLDGLNAAKNTIQETTQKESGNLATLAMASSTKQRILIAVTIVNTAMLAVLIYKVLV